MDFDYSTELFFIPPAKDARLLHPLVLAYLGDAIHEMYMRQYAISKNHQKPQQLHKFTTRYVSAKAQARILHNMMEYLDADEIEVVKRGRNAKSGSSPQRADILDYRHSTGFECLLGYLYYHRQHARLKEILQLSIRYVESQEI